MRNVMIFAMAMYFLLITCIGYALPARETATGSWEEIIHENEVNQPVRMAAFLNDRFGITGGMGGAGRIHYTRDGGETWIMSKESGGCIFGVDIVNENVIWACGRMTGVSFKTPGGIRMSYDGARTWGSTTNYETTAGTSRICFIDSSSGWVYNKYTLLRTNDGGFHWEKISLPETAKGVAAITYRTPGIVYILDNKFTLYSSEDEGKTWKSIESDFKGIKKDSKITRLNELSTADICFTDEHNGIAALNVELKDGTHFLVYRTSDGGRTWKKENLPVQINLGIPYLSQDGKYLTVSVISTRCEISVFRYSVEEHFR